MTIFRKALACLAITFAVAAVPVSALAIDLAGDLGNVNYQVKRSVGGRIVTVARDIVHQATSPNTNITVTENGATNDVTISSNVADTVFLGSIGSVLVQGSKSEGQITNDDPGVILLTGDLVYNPAVASFVSGSGSALIFVYTAEIKTVVKEDSLLGIIEKGTAKIKIFPGMVEVVNVDTAGGPVTVGSVQGTGIPASLKIKLPALTFWELIVG